MVVIRVSAALLGICLASSSSLLHIGHFELRKKQVNGGLEKEVQPGQTWRASKKSTRGWKKFQAGMVGKNEKAST